MTHGQADEAEDIVSGIEEHVDRETDEPLEEPEESIEVRQRSTVGFGEIRSVFGEHRRRSVLGFMLMMSQAFLYNAIFFTYALILTDFYSVPADRIGWYLLPFAVGNFLGPLLLGRFFDTVGPRMMISGTYIISGVLLASPATCSSRTPHRDELTIALVGDLLLRLGGRELGLPDGQRDLPDGDPGDGDRVLLRRRRPGSAASSARRCTATTSPPATARRCSSATCWAPG